MHLVTFIIALVFCLIAAILFGRGLVKLHQRSSGARGLIGSGAFVWVLGILVAAIVFGVFGV